MQTIYAWRMQHKKHEESSKNDNAIKHNKLQEIESENAKLKKICIALTFENVSLKETLDKKLLKQGAVSM